MAARNDSYKTLKDLSRILCLFNTPQVEERSIAEISKALNMFPSKVSRMIRTLEPEGFFERNSETGKYRLGIGFFELGIAYIANLPLRKIIRPHIEQMAKELNLTASWGILRNDRVAVIDRVQNLNIDLLSHRVGLNLPIHSTSIGKVLLAYLPEEDRARVLQSINLTRYTDATITDRDLIIENLRLVREKGFSIDSGETHEDLLCIGCPVMDGSGKVIAALNLMDEKSRTSLEKLLQRVDYLREKAQFISRQLGYRSNT